VTGSSYRYRIPVRTLSISCMRRVLKIGVVKLIEVVVVVVVVEVVENNSSPSLCHIVKKFKNDCMKSH
jgi:Tfp pilus assembly protein PilE